MNNTQIKQFKPYTVVVMRGANWDDEGQVYVLPEGLKSVMQGIGQSDFIYIPEINSSLNKYGVLKFIGIGSGQQNTVDHVIYSQPEDIRNQLRVKRKNRYKSIGKQTTMEIVNKRLAELMR